MKSMTGYGKSECQLENKTVTIEIKSLNSKQLDITCKLPIIYKDRELDIRNEIAKELERGKIEVFLTYDQSSEATGSIINESAIKSYYHQINKVAQEFNINSGEQIFQAILRLPDAVRTEKQECDEKEWLNIFNCLKEAIFKNDNFRVQEGNALEKDITKRINLIKELLGQVKKFEKNRIETIKKRISNNLNEFFANDSFDKNRFEQELIYYLEKIDISEEKTRLENHCVYFLQILKENVPIGKKLGFVAQEIGREINTIGSKANDSDIQRIVVLIKDELEKIKEQLMNVL